MTDEELIKKYVLKEKQKEALEQLASGYPVQYIIGNVEFYNSVIDVNENVLIPRFETEYLVEKTINYIKKLNLLNPKILDIGTGSGCIAIALKKTIDAFVTAIDISEVALNLAQENARLNKVDIDFKKGDITKKPNGKYDCLISNPPYIPYDGYIEEKVKKYEPHLALFAPDGGLYFYKKILDYAFEILNKKFLIAFEIGDNQKDLLEKYLKEKYSQYSYVFEKDLNGLDRYLFIYNE